MPLSKKEFPQILKDILKQANEIDNGKFSGEEVIKRTEKLTKEADVVFEFDKKYRKLL